jgi:hypothetical protein
VAQPKKEFFVNIIIVCYYQLASQVVWDGWRWQPDASAAAKHLTEQDARMAFRRIAARGALTDRDRAVVVADFGLTTEHVLYRLEDGSVVAGPLREEVTGEAITDEQVQELVSSAEVVSAIVAIAISLDRDPHLARCPRAEKSGPEGTLACAECDRAKWMHNTRHDTCESFRWVTRRTLTNKQIEELRLVRGLPHETRVACARALNEFGGYAVRVVQEAKAECAEAINAAHRQHAAAITAAL